MTTPTGIRSGVGFRNAQIFALDASGYPAATSTTAYEGLRISGAKALTITDPEPRRITHVGDDTIIAIDALPPNEGISGELHAGKLNDAVDAILTGQLQFTSGSIAMFGIGTDKRGYENQVGLMGYRQSLDTDPDSVTFGKRLWEFRLMPKVLLIGRDTGFNDQPEDFVYSVIPMKVSSHLWGTAFTLLAEGFRQAQMIRGVSWFKPKVVAWKGDNTATAFTFPTAAQAVSATNITVWKNGVEVTSGLTKATTGVTFDTKPASGDMVVCLYETN